jgi:CheY-like chemotaxis protein/GGDEF domain-containing protein
VRGIAEIGRGLWRVSASAPGEALSVNCYLAAVEGGFCLVDAGPASLGEALVAEASAIAPASALRAIVLLDESAFSYTAIPAWVAAGFSGEVVADWRVVAARAMGSVRASFRDLRESDERIVPGSELHALRPAGAHGPIALYHSPSGSLLSGRFGSSLGRDLPERCEDPRLGQQRQFMESFGYGPPPDVAGIPATPGLRAICPRFGSLLPEAAARSVLSVAGAGPAAACADAPEEILPLMGEIESLKSSNYRLKEAMIVASDAALRDPASQLYGRDYADAFVQALLERGSDFTAAYVRIDGIKELNRVLGAKAVDVLLGDLASVAREREPDGFLFRWTGPVVLLVLEGGNGDAFGRLDALREAISSERRFARPISCSIAVARSGELGGEGPSNRLASLHALARGRLKLLDRRGGNAVLDHSEAEAEDRSLVLALDSNLLFLDFLAERLDREGFRTRAAARGGEALELMDSLKPELVIADLSLPQFDAFQIRMRMRASADLHDVPFVLLADVKTDEVVARAHSLSIFHVFEKPVSMVELVGVARNLLARSGDGA